MRSPGPRELDYGREMTSVGLTIFGGSLDKGAPDPVFNKVSPPTI